MRFNDTLDVNFKYDNILETSKIAPMLLMPFIENSFKHGSLKNGVLSINIDLSCDEDAINFYIDNTNSKSKQTKKGIGLENMQKRLDLLYKNKYTLTIDNTIDFYKVHLKLNNN